MTATILDRIVADKARRVAERERERPLAAVEAAARARPAPVRNFLATLSAPAANGAGVHVIAEIKKASPSKGVIRADFRPLELAGAYAAGGASALSVLTEEDHFQGSDAYLEAIAREVPLPALRKDFILGEYQVFEAKLLGASAYLLIVDCLSPGRLRALIALGAELGLTPLVEAHTAAEVDTALDCGAPVVGINNRDLKTFDTRLETTFGLRKRIPAGIPVVSESGISARGDLDRLRAAGVQAALIGESLMRAPDVGARLRDLLV